MRDAEEPPKPESSQRFVLSSVDEPASALPPQVRLLALTRSLSHTHTHTHTHTNQLYFHKTFSMVSAYQAHQCQGQCLTVHQILEK